jgi:hypothetical protein
VAKLGHDLGLSYVSLSELLFLGKVLKVLVVSDNFKLSYAAELRVLFL